jgi:hypothetical protein
MSRFADLARHHIELNHYTFYINILFVRGGRKIIKITWMDFTQTFARLAYFWFEKQMILVT